MDHFVTHQNSLVAQRPVCSLFVHDNFHLVCPARKWARGLRGEHEILADWLFTSLCSSDRVRCIARYMALPLTLSTRPRSGEWGFPGCALCEYSSATRLVYVHSYIGGISPFIGTMLALISAGPINDHAVRILSKRNKGVFEAEMRLVLVMPCGICFAIGEHEVAVAWIVPMLTQK
jgi:hypothetical protein